MDNYRQITPEEFNRSPFHLIGKEWMLITTEDSEKESLANAMTASWGGLGILWNTPVATIYVRPQRYTFDLIEKNDRVSLCFLGSEYKKALSLCGSKSGRDLDKIKESGLHTTSVNGTPVIEESKIIMICKKLYADDLKEEKFIDREHLSHYNGDYHRFYILEIETILEKKQRK